MSLAKFNSNGSVFDYRLESDARLPFKKLKELGVGTEFQVLGFFVNNKSKYGASPVAYNKDVCVNLPKKWVKKIEEIKMDAESLKTINAGKAFARVVTWNSQTYGACYDIELFEK